MQGMRDLIRSSLARSLRTLTEEDRLAAALPLVCGTTLAAHCEVARLDENRTLHLRIDGQDWLAPLLAMRDILQHDLQRVGGVHLEGLHFMQVGTPLNRPPRPSSAAPSEASSADQRTMRRTGKPHPKRRPA